MTLTNTSPNMQIVVPVPVLDPGPEYAVYLYNALYSTVDQHNHTSGKGVPVPTTGLSGALQAAQFPALTGDVTTVAGALATTLAATVNGTLGQLSKSTGVSVHGTNTNDLANAGYIGEYVESVISAASPSLAGTTQFQDLTSIPLTAGDWDVTLVVDFITNGSTTQSVQIGISTTTGNSSTGLVFGSNRVQCPWIATVTDDGRVIPAYRMSLNTPTTVYGKIAFTYSAGVPQYRCRLSARRVR